MTAMLSYIKKFTNSPWFRRKDVMYGLWILVALVSSLAKMRHHNNFNIFRYVYYNTISGTSLYAPSTDGGFWDTNHYGPVFSLIIAPFAVMPEWLGLIMWNVCLAALLLWAVCLVCKDRMQVFVIWFCAHELMTALMMQQFNVATAAGILLSFYFVSKEKDHWATLAIVIGTLVKIYGIVGVAFFFFSRHKARYAVSLVVWTAVVVCLPMLISSPEYQFGQYAEWASSLTGKNVDNTLSAAQNISIIGIITKMGYALTEGHANMLAVMHDGAPVNADNWWLTQFSALWVIAPACLTMAIAYFRIEQWKNEPFRLNVLAAVLMFVVLFSTGTESSSYIIGMTGCAIWYCALPWQRSGADRWLMVLVFIFTSLSPSDLFPAFIRREYIQPYALKALPVALVWIKQMVEMMTLDYTPNKHKEDTI